MNDKERNNLIKKAIAFSLTAACIIALCCWLFIGHGSFAWFAKNKQTSANGLSIQSNADDIRFENVITITPSVGGSVTNPFITYYIPTAVTIRCRNRRRATVWKARAR